MKNLAQLKRHCAAVTAGLSTPQKAATITWTLASGNAR